MSENNNDDEAMNMLDEIFDNSNDIPDFIEPSLEELVRRKEE